MLTVPLLPPFGHKPNPLCHGVTHTYRGEVIRVGGLYQKLDAALRMKAELALVPAQNEMAAAMVKPDGLEVDYVSNIWELVCRALEGSEKYPSSPQPGE